MRVGLLRDSETCFGRMDCVQDRRRNRSGREVAVWRQPRFNKLQMEEIV